MDDEYSYPLHMSGCATASYEDKPEDIVKQLYAVVREVTGYSPPEPVKIKMGFY